MPKGCFQQVKVNGSHLRREDGIPFTHLFGKFNALKAAIARRFDRRSFAAFTDCRKKTADTDTHCTKVGTFVNFKQGVHFSMRFGNFLHLVGGNRIQTAAEAGQLNKREVILPCGKLGSAV